MKNIFPFLLSQASLVLQMDDQYDLGIKYSCDSCFGDISQVVRIKCAECTELDLCVNCFSSGASVKDHLPLHDYYVIEPLTFPIYTADWMAQEELLLLEGIEKKGIGNWNDIARHVGGKTGKECETHYHHLYLESPEFPLPNPAVTVSKEEKKAICDAPLSHSESQTSVSDEQAIILTSQPASHEIAGYMPKRGDFECEFDNDFENIIKDIQFNERDDSPMETQLKLAMLHNYWEFWSEEKIERDLHLIVNLCNLNGCSRKRRSEKGRKKCHSRYSSICPIFVPRWI